MVFNLTNKKEKDLYQFIIQSVDVSLNPKDMAIEIRPRPSDEPLFELDVYMSIDSLGWQMFRTLIMFDIKTSPRLFVIVRRDLTVPLLPKV